MVVKFSILLSEKNLKSSGVPIRTLKLKQFLSHMIENDAVGSLTSFERFCMTF